MVALATTDKDKQESSRKAATAVLLTLHDHHAASFAAQLAQLPLPQQATVRGLLSAHLPDLDAEISAQAKQQRRPARSARRVLGTMENSRDKTRPLKFMLFSDNPVHI